MSRNGSGTYSLPAGNPVVTGTTITSSWANTTMQNIADALTQSVASDGQTPMSGVLNMATNKISNVSNPTLAQDAATKTYVDAKTDGTASGSFTSLAYSTTLTGGTGVVNLGSGQFYKDASGNVGIGVTPFVNTLSAGLDLKNGAGLFGFSNNFYLTNNLYYDSAWKYKGTGFGTVVIGNSADGAIQFNGTSASGSAGGAATVSERMRIAADGSVGIGTSSPIYPIDVVATNPRIRLSATSTGYATSQFVTASGSSFFGRDNAAAGFFGVANATVVYSSTSDPIVFYTGAAEKARIDSSGDVMIGRTSSVARLAVQGSSVTNPLFYAIGSTAGDVGTAAVRISKFDNNSTTSQIFVQFLINNTASGSGQINANGSGAAAFGAFSDFRLKENIVDLPSQLNNICSLRPVEFDYKTGGHQMGFIAQEMQEVYPDVVGEGENGMLMVTGWSKTEARLVKAIQELNAEVQALKQQLGK